jgi:hypothetical protein
MRLTSSLLRRPPVREEAIAMDKIENEVLDFLKTGCDLAVMKIRDFADFPRRCFVNLSIIGDMVGNERAEILSFLGNLWSDF